MLSHIFFDQNRIYIRITVFTQMSASIIGTYICPQKACALNMKDLSWIIAPQ